MAAPRRSGLGRGLSSLIPAEVGSAEAPAPGRPGAAGAAGGRHPAQPPPAPPGLRRGVAGVADRLGAGGRRAPAGARPPGRRRRLRAHRRRAAVAGRPSCGAAEHPGPGQAGRRHRLARAGRRREPPPRGSQPARRGGRLLPAHRGVPSHPRAGGRPGGQEPGGHLEHPAPVPAPAGGAEARRRTASSAPATPRPCWARPIAPSSSTWPARTVGRGPDRPRRRGGGPEPERARGPDGRRPATRAATADGGPSGGERRRPGTPAWSSSRSCWRRSWRPGSPSRPVPAGASC